MKHLLTYAALALTATSAFSQTNNYNPASIAVYEKLSRGVVAVPMEKGNFISWRSLATDAKDIVFDLYRDGEIIAKGLTGATCFSDPMGTATSVYKVTSRDKSGIKDEGTVALNLRSNGNEPFLSIPLRKPADGTAPDGKPYRYTPNDCSCGDIDGDGNYELFLKWDPSNSHDNAHNGYTGDVLIDCYSISTDADKNFKWRINLGQNIRAGAHYTQFLVYDFDGDGKVELICKTAPGSVDGTGKFVTEAATDKAIRKTNNKASYVNNNGRILSGPEYLTVFSGEDGHAIHTIYYNPNRAFECSWDKGNHMAKGIDYDVKGWGDGSPGNRGERFLAGVAFLGATNNGAKVPSAVMCRGYYTSSNLWAVDFDGKELKTRWLHTSPSRSEWTVRDANGNVTASANGLKATAYAQGAHSLAVADVDGDGFDEITYGSAAIDHDGTLLYSTGLGHGDAQHLADLDPDRPGLEYYMVHEERPAGADLRDARTGEILYRETDKQDTGRGLSADIDPNHRGAEFWCSAGKRVHSINGDVICETEGWTPQNFRIFWDGDLYEELIGNGGRNQMPGTREGRGRQSYYVAKWNGSGVDHLPINGRDFSEWGNSASCNGTKATPCLQADLFGDWREEVVLYDASDNAHLNIFSTNIPTPYRVTTLMHDHVYRMGVAWQNVTYNQPPHLGYYLPSKF